MCHFAMANDKIPLATHVLLQLIYKLLRTAIGRNFTISYRCKQGVHSAVGVNDKLANVLEIAAR